MGQKPTWRGMRFTSASDPTRTSEVDFATSALGPKADNFRIPMEPSVHARFTDTRAVQQSPLFTAPKAFLVEVILEPPLAFLWYRDCSP